MRRPIPIETDPKKLLMWGRRPSEDDLRFLQHWVSTLEFDANLYMREPDRFHRVEVLREMHRLAGRAALLILEVRRLRAMIAAAHDFAPEKAAAAAERLALEARTIHEDERVPRSPEALGGPEAAAAHAERFGWAETIRRDDEPAGSGSGSDGAA